MVVSLSPRFNKVGVCLGRQPTVSNGFSEPVGAVGPNRYRILEGIPLLLSLVLISVDIKAGKNYRERHPRVYKR